MYSSTQLVKMSTDSKFVGLTADVVRKLTIAAPSTRSNPMAAANTLADEDSPVEVQLPMEVNASKTRRA